MSTWCVLIFNRSWSELQLVLNLFLFFGTIWASKSVLIKCVLIKKTECVFNYFMLMFNSNEPIKVAHLQKLTNQSVSMLNGAIVIEMATNFFSEEKKNFARLIKREMF